MSQQHLSLYITREQPCSYYDDRLSASLIPDPQLPMSAELYSLLIARGFRRSGEFVYRPHCKGCNACVPARINVARFHPNRNQRRCLKRNADLRTRLVTARYSEEYFALYQRYLNTRHDDGSMANPQPEDFSNFLLNSWQSTLFIESRLQGRLLAVAVVDFLQTGPSAVYTFFEPAEAARSLGTFAVLQQIWLARLYQHPHVYLGYWIRNHRKMDYKRHFAGLELYRDEQWQAAPDRL
ncbi:MAG TPA: arginyltransferase [Gammaproteobacteria bacterium]